MKELGRYNIGEVIAASRHAILRRVSDQSGFVIKVFPVNLADEASYLRRFDSTLEQVAQLEHPHILRPYDYGEDQGYTYIVLPYLKADTLADRFANEETFSVQPALHILRQVADALDYAHENGFVHRNVKPSNILFDDAGNAMLADVGLAELLEDTYELQGHPQLLNAGTFVAPEQQPAAPVQSTVDIYALGVLASRLLIGKLPDKAVAILEQARAISPAKRYPTATTFINALTEAMTGEKVALQRRDLDSKTTSANWLRRIGCGLLVIIWLILMTIPCIVTGVLVNGEVTYDLSDKPGHQIRIFKLESDDARGFGFSLGSLENETSDSVCVRTHVHYMVWEGQAESADFCQCYAHVTGTWSPDSSLECH